MPEELHREVKGSTQASGSVVRGFNYKEHIVMNKRLILGVGHDVELHESSWAQTRGAGVASQLV